jgi:FkbM family methyltransferase
MRDQTASAAQDHREVARWEEQLPGLLRRLRLPTHGVVQVGAHTGQEVGALTDCGFRRLVMMEPNLDHTEELNEQLERYHRAAELAEPEDGHQAREIVVAAAGREPGRATLYVTEWDQQASMLPPLLPLSARNAVVREDSIPVIPVRDVQHGCNVMVIDAQGAELEVLAGTDLTRLDLAVIEGSTWARYSEGSTLETIAEYMESQGWREVAVWDHVRPHVADVAWLAPHRSATPIEAA